MSTKQKLGQAGAVSLLVTMVMLLVVSLIVIGFAQLARRNQREALDRQLASQAYYAAESGINDVIKTVGTGPGKYDPATATNYTSCDATSPSSFVHQFLPSQSALHSTGGQMDVGYTCLLVSSQLPTVVTKLQSMSDTQALHFILSKSTNLTFNWTGISGNASATGASCPSNGPIANDFLPVTNWNGSGCAFGGLRVDLFDTAADANSTDPETMSSHTAALYLMPSNSKTTTVNYGHASVLKTQCTAGSCTAQLANGAGKDYYVRISSLYQPAGTVTIGSTNNAQFGDAQLNIDSTGRAQDELRRIQVRINLGPSDPTAASPAGFALQSGSDICKHFITLGPGYVAGGTNPGDPDDDIPSELCSGP